MYSGPIPGVILLRASIAMCLLVMGGLPASIVTAQVDHSSLTYSEAIGFFAQEKTIKQDPKQEEEEIGAKSCNLTQRRLPRAAGLLSS
jgi:hypothetical protein